MPVDLSPPDPADILPIDGVRIGVTEAGIRKVNRKDLTVMVLDEGSAVAGVFTLNRFCAAPVQLCKKHLAQGGSVRALVINTGNANAGTGTDGLARALITCEELAKRLGVDASQVLPFSTGVIMETLPVDRLVAGMDGAISDLDKGHWLRAANGIMTTDTVPKAFSAQATIEGQRVSATGISKGAGMIRPNMATMLGFIATDACIEQSVLQQLAREVADATFNRITIDGDTSTNDSMVLIATQKAPHTRIDSLDSDAGRALKALVLEVARKLAQAIVRDGEGATKFITIVVSGGASPQECRQVAYAIAHSPLVKTAFFASDPNLGRILAAVGYAGVADLNPDLIDLYLGDVHVATRGSRHPDYLEARGQAVMAQAEITVHVKLGRGNATDTVWTCDLSHDYVSINADYRS